VGGGGGQAGSAPNVPGMQPGDVVESISPQQKEYLGERGKALGTQRAKIDADASAAMQSNLLWDQLRNESQTWTPDKFAEQKGELNKYYLAVKNAFGAKDPTLADQVGDFEAFQKKRWTGGKIDCEGGFWEGCISGNADDRILSALSPPCQSRGLGR
jgi:hypothetical protein